jgi:galactonate dehydratase
VALTSVGLSRAGRGAPVKDVEIVRVTTLRHEAWPNLVWVEIEDSDANVGLGETFSLAEAVVGYIHEGVAPYLLGEIASDRSRHWQTLYRHRGRGGIGTEARGASAIDIALWDLAGRRAGQPLYEMLGGRSRHKIRAYNTCAGPNYVKGPAVAGRLYTGDFAGDQFDDLQAFKERPEELAESLLNMGISAMKIWPLDEIAESTQGLHISPAQMREGIEPIRRIKAAFGEQMDIALELHLRWHLRPALEIARATEEFGLMWIEDAFRVEDLDSLDRLCRATSTPILTGEQLGGRWSYKEVLQRTGVGIIMSDPVWTGGVSEIRKVADLTAAFQRSFTPHDCTGPVGLAVGTHVSLYAETAIYQELVRAFRYGWYERVADGLPVVTDGFIAPPGDRPGHGVTLKRSASDQGWTERTARI